MIIGVLTAPPKGCLKPQIYIMGCSPPDLSTGDSDFAGPSTVLSDNYHNQYQLIINDDLISMNDNDDDNYYNIITHPQKTMENHHAINGKIHYVYGHFPLLFVCSPEGNPIL